MERVTWNVPGVFVLPMKKTTKTKTTRNRLTLNTETVRVINSDNLMHVEGGSGCHQGSTWQPVKPKQ